ncbi:MAG: hypothetical protein KGM96_08490 [Acidobacteriota bacterium]|nr:hypothetical protein [Acidobacteriota bacterium]
MFTAALALASTLWTPWIQINSTIIVRWIVGMGIGSTTCFLYWLFTREEAAEETYASSPNVEREVDVPSTANASSYGNIVNIYPPGTVPEHSPLPVAPPPQDNRVPDLTLKVGWGTVKQEFGKFEFIETGGNRAYIVEVINNPASTLGVAYPARRIVARITFKCGGRHLFIDRAFWVGREENEIDLEVGKTAQVLVGLVNGTQWTLFENPTSTPFNLMDWDAQHEAPITREFPDMGAEPIVIEIHIISVANRHESRTLVHKRILVEIEGESGLKQIETRFL